MNLAELFYYVVSLSVMGSILAIGLLIIKRLFRHKLSANWHYYIWFVLIARLLIPFTPSAPFSVFNFIPHYQQAIELPQLTMPSETAATTAIQTDNSADITQETLPGPKNVQRPLVATAKAWFNWQTLALTWMIGVSAIFFYILLINLWLLFKIKKLPLCDSADILRILQECKANLKVHSEVSVVYDDSLKSPALFGLLHPKIIISQELVKKLSSEELRYIFLHELSHLKRGDLLVNGLVLAIQVIYWFNPLVWLALSQMKQDCEIACDATALAALKPEEYKKYGQTIISLLELLSEPYWVPGTLGFVSKFQVRRIVMISKNKQTSLKWAVVALALTLVVGCSSLTNPINPPDGQNQGNPLTNNPQTDTATPNSNSPSSPDSNSIVYKNTEYGFSFTLPESWKGYSIVSSQWEGLAIGSQQSGQAVVETGPIISIRDPKWTAQTPRQDIPIMVFTLEQWNSLQKDVFSIGAAPIGPSELGRNNSYVMALPARYQFAFPEGYKEVETILESKPLQTQTTQLNPDATKSLVLNMMVFAKQGKVINSDYAAKTTTIEDVEKVWGKADKTDYVATAKGGYATYTGRQVVFGINKGEQLFEVRSFDSRLKSVTLSKVKEVLGNPAYDAKTNGQELIGYTAGSEFKIEMIFPQPTKDNPNPVLDHYNVLYPLGTVNSMADDPGRQW
ncbi:MAG TPA: M56 family metallopeptidase [Desulfosporosinus sp.]|nr:M56 family metallopeptidase [Desulfosporosinus sp.]